MTGNTHEHRGVEYKNVSVQLGGHGRHWSLDLANTIQLLESEGWLFQSLYADVGKPIEATVTVVRATMRAHVIRPPRGK